VQGRIRGLGGEITAMGIEQVGEMNRSEFDRYGKLVKEAGIRAD